MSTSLSEIGRNYAVLVNAALNGERTYKDGDKKYDVLGLLQDVGINLLDSGLEGSASEICNFIKTRTFIDNSLIVLPIARNVYVKAKKNVRLSTEQNDQNLPYISQPEFFDSIDVSRGGYEEVDGENVYANAGKSVKVNAGGHPIGNLIISTDTLKNYSSLKRKLKERGIGAEFDLTNSEKRAENSNMLSRRLSSFRAIDARDDGDSYLSKAKRAAVKGLADEAKVDYKNAAESFYSAAREYEFMGDTTIANEFYRRALECRFPEKGDGWEKAEDKIPQPNLRGAPQPDPEKEFVRDVIAHSANIGQPETKML